MGLVMGTSTGNYTNILSVTKTRSLFNNFFRKKHYTIWKN